MSKYWSEIVKRLDPYIPGEQPQDKKYIKLNTNENPYPPSPLVLEAIERGTNESLRLYPDPNSQALLDKLSNEYQVNSNQVFVGNGSDEVLALSFQAFFNPDKPILFPDITYSFYPVYCSLFKIDYELIPLDGNLSIPTQEFMKRNGGIIFPNPNAPTGEYVNLRDIRGILEHNKDSVVIIDEAYIDFGGQSATKLVNEYPNLLVIQTFSKSRSLAGLRIGFAIGNEDLIEALNRVKNSFNSYPIDRLAMNAAVAALDDKVYFEETTTKVIQTRKNVQSLLQQLGFTIIPSQANFLFISHSDYDAENIYKQLKNQGILVRFFNKPRINNFLRVSIGTTEEMEEFISAVEKIVK